MAKFGTFCFPSSNDFLLSLAELDRLVAGAVLGLRDLSRSCSVNLLFGLDKACAGIRVAFAPRGCKFVDIVAADDALDILRLEPSHAIKT